MTEGEFRALSAEMATDAEDLEVAKLKLDETADQVERVKFDLSLVEDAERLNMLVSGSIMFYDIERISVTFNANHPRSSVVTLFSVCIKKC